MEHMQLLHGDPDIVSLLFLRLLRRRLASIGCCGPVSRRRCWLPGCGRNEFCFFFLYGDYFHDFFLYGFIQKSSHYEHDTENNQQQDYGGKAGYQTYGKIYQAVDYAFQIPAKSF